MDRLWQRKPQEGRLTLVNAFLSPQFTFTFFILGKTREEVAFPIYVSNHIDWNDWMPLLQFRSSVFRSSALWMNPRYACHVMIIKLTTRHGEQPRWLWAVANTSLLVSRRESGPTGASLKGGEPSTDHTSVYFHKLILERIPHVGCKRNPPVKEKINWCVYLRNQFFSPLRSSKRKVENHLR